MIILDLNLIENNEYKAYNQDGDLSKMCYYNLNKIENSNKDNREYIDYENNGDFENLDNE